MRDTIRGIVGKLKRGIGGYLLVVVDLDTYVIHSYYVNGVGDYGVDFDLHNPLIIGWYQKPIKMAELRSHIERRIEKRDIYEEI